MGTAQFVSAGFGIVYSVVTARGLGPALRGDLFLIQAYFNIATVLVGLSTATIMTVQVSREQFDLAEIHSASVFLSLLQGFGGGLITLLIYLRTTRLPGASLGILAFFFLSLPAMLYKTNWSAIFLGLGRVGLISIYLVFDVFLTTVGAGIVLFLLRAGLEGILIMLAIESAIMAAIGFYLTVKVSRSRWRWSSKCISDLLQQGWKQHVAVTITQLYFRADAFILARFLSPAGLGQYAVARGLADRITLAFTPFAQVMFPHIASNDPARSRWFTQTTFRQLAVLAILLSAALIVVMPRFILIMYGNAYQSAIKLAEILCIALIVRSITVPIELWFVGGLLRPKLNAITSAFMLVVVVVSGYALTMRAGTAGMAIAMLLSFVLSLAFTIWLGNRNGLGIRELIPGPRDLRYVLAKAGSFRTRG
jgi:O-antigen/teichoic acid export membrane protein